MYRVMIISFFITVVLVGCVKLYFDSPTTNSKEIVNTSNIAKEIEDNNDIGEQ